MLNKHLRLQLLAFLLFLKLNTLAQNNNLYDNVVTLKPYMAFLFILKNENDSAFLYSNDQHIYNL